MPIVELTVWGGCSTPQRSQQPCEFDALESQRTLRDLGWQPLPAGLWVCPVCWPGLADPADFAASKVLAKRALAQHGN